MKKVPEKDMLPEYDFSGGVRGKYVARLAKGSNVVLLDEDVRRLYPNSAAVNSALRALAQAVAVTNEASGSAARSGRTARKRDAT